MIIKIIGYVLKSNTGEYYTGKSYIDEGERYAINVPSDEKIKSKIYSTRKRAERACKMEFINCEFEVEKLQ